MKNIFLRKDSTYTRMVEKCAQELYGKEPEQDNFTFYIADSKGIEVWTSDDINRLIPIDTYMCHKNVILF